jgi:hypothetical protein
MRSDGALNRLAKDAYAAFDKGSLSQASKLFAELCLEVPDHPDSAYMLGLAEKYRCNWVQSLEANLNALKNSSDENEGALWNAAIAATALGNKDLANELWVRAKVRLPPGENDGPTNWGVCSIRLNAWSDGETLFAERLCPVSAKLLNVPFPESGYRFGDVVLNDGARTGERRYGDVIVPVLNALTLLERSMFETFSVFIQTPSSEALTELLASTSDSIPFIEDWTKSVRVICRRCSYGVAHQHATEHKHVESSDSDTERNVGFAAASREVVEQALARWQLKFRDAKVDAVIEHNNQPSMPEDGFVWWRSDDEVDQKPEAD